MKETVGKNTVMVEKVKKDHRFSSHRELRLEPQQCKMWLCEEIEITELKYSEIILCKYENMERRVREREITSRAIMGIKRDKTNSNIILTITLI